MYKVLIIDDHISMCDSLGLVLENTGEFSVEGKLPNAALAEPYCLKMKPDLIFMDICTENGASGLEAAKLIREKFPEIKIIVMTGFNDVTYEPKAKEAGARAFIVKTKSLEHFVETAKGVMRGETYYSDPKTIPVQAGNVPLSDREMEVLKLICKHFTNKEIAEELFISENTVKYHKVNILAKTGFTKTVDLVFHVIKSGWINPLY